MTTETLLPPITGLQAPRPRIFSRALVLTFLVNIGALTSFYLLISVVPLYARSVGAGGAVAGMATGAMMFATVAAEFATPRLMARFGNRLVLALGLVLLGAPALALTGSGSVTVIMVVCVIRGAGFAITMVVAGSLVASLVPPSRRGEGLGIFGVVVGVPGVIALPLGVWVAGHVGYQTVFVAGAVAGLAGLAVVSGLPDGRAAASPEQSVGVLARLRTPALTRPVLVFTATTMAVGIVVAFVPLAAGRASGSLVAVALLAQSVTMTLARWWAGRFADRHGAGRLLVPGVLLSAAGVLGLVWAGNPVILIGGMLVFGAGFGAIQSASLVLMLDRVPASGYDTISALWNMAYDGGWGLGAAGFGIIAVHTGYTAAFALTACLVLVALVPAVCDRRSS
jgi:predicted MFS family arabinose efflux permease